MDDHEPQLPSWRQQGALDAYQEAQAIMNPIEVQITDQIITYLQSWEFLTLFILVGVYRLARHVTDTIPDAVKRYCAWRNRS